MAKVEIKLQNLHKAFGTHVVLDNISLEICQGEMVAIVGGSGCGKTVLLNHVLGLLNADAGRLFVANHEKEHAPTEDLMEMDDDDVARLHTHWGVVFQNNALFSGTVLDNLKLWLDEIGHMNDTDIHAIACHVLNAVALPFDDAFLNTDTESLSGGMAKRLAVARALAQDPAVIFYDEPTTGLDPTSATQIQDLILQTHTSQGERHKKRTTLIITHDKDLLRRLKPRIVMLDQGNICFDGPFESFESEDNSIIRPYFDLMPVLHTRKTDGT